MRDDRQADDESRRLREIIVATASTLARLYVVAVILAGTTVYVRLNGSSKVEAYGITFRLSLLPFVVLVLTIFHALYVWALTDYIRAWAEWNPTPEAHKELLHGIRMVDSVALRGFTPRTRERRLRFVTIYIMEARDPSTWFAYGAIALLALALLPWTYSEGSTTLVGSGASLFATLLGVGMLVIGNWYIAGVWMIRISCLSLPHRSRPHKWGPFVGSSGGIAMMVLSAMFIVVWVAALVALAIGELF